MDAKHGGDKSSDGRSGPETGSGTMGAVGNSKSGPGGTNVPTQPTSSSDAVSNKLLPAHVHVFNIAELREKIVEHAICDGEEDDKLDRRTATTLRLVGKAWNDTVVCILRQNQQPFFRLSAYGLGENLGRFCNTFSSSVCILPFQLLIRDLEPEMKRDEELCNLLTRCGPGLVELTVWMNAIGAPCNIKFEQLSLPHLSKLEITVLSSPRPEENDGETVGLRVIKSVLKEATALSELKVTLLSVPAAVSIFELITLPSTITKLSVRGDVRSRDLKMLSWIPLPNLTTLDLFLQYNSLADGSFLWILETYRTSLKKLSIEDYSVPPPNTTLISFPVMDKLEYFSIDLLKHDMNDTSMHSLVESFPKLRTLHLQNLINVTHRKWTGYSKFNSVTSLHFRFAQPFQREPPNPNWREGIPPLLAVGNLGLQRTNNNFITSLKMETMQSFNFAFPNVRQLELDFCGSETSGLEYVFREMTQLTHLKINYGGSGPNVNSHFWDAVLTGLPPETVIECRNDPSILERIEAEEEQLGSIKNLRELCSFSLIDVSFTYLRTPLISKVTFRLALLKMPKLKKIFMTRRFALVCGEMVQECKSSGRSLVTKF